MKHMDVTALGELLIDFTENGKSANGNPLFEANPGGAPCNVLAMLAGLGRKTAFIGKVGDDLFGKQLAETLQSIGIGTDGLISDVRFPTTLAFVHTLAGGEREFSFVRNPGADCMLTKEEVPAALLQDTKVFHFGTLSLTHKEAREATRFAVDTAIQSGAYLSFDPNLREPLWAHLEDAKIQMEYGLSKCHLLKISDNEVEFLLGHTDFDTAAAQLMHAYPNLQLVLITCGADGSLAYSRTAKASAPVYPVSAVEKTGAGDTFLGCALHYLLTQNLQPLDASKLTALLHFANAGAALITTRKGALKVMPKADEITALMEKEPQ